MTGFPRISLTLSLLVPTGASSQPRNVEALYAAGVEALQRGQPYEALEALNSVAAVNPSYRDVQILLGQSCLLAGLTRLAKRHFEQALAADPRNGQAAVFLGLMLYQEARYFEAVEALDRAHSLAPGNPYPLIYRGRSFLKLGRAKEARVDVEAALARSPSDPTARAALAEIELGEGHFEKAEELLRSVLEDEPQDFEARTLLARVLFQAGRPAEAVPLLRAVLETIPDRTDLLYLMAQALLRSGDTEAGRATLDRFKELSAQEERIRVLEAKVNTDADDIESRIQLVRLLLEQGQGDLALPHLAVLQEVLPTDPRVHALGEQLERLRNRQ